VIRGGRQQCIGCTPLPAKLDLLGDGLGREGAAWLETPSVTIREPARWTERIVVIACGSTLGDQVVVEREVVGLVANLSKRGVFVLFLKLCKLPTGMFTNEPALARICWSPNWKAISPSRT
jgi:hypothetical protein